MNTANRPERVPGGAGRPGQESGWGLGTQRSTSVHVSPGRVFIAVREQGLCLRKVNTDM